MYTCTVCGGEFSYLIFEYNSLVCEKCSIRKNIKNTEEFDAMAEAAGEFSSLDPEVEEIEEIGGQDVEQLFELIDKIDNPQLREDFRDLAQQYFEEELG